MKIPQQIRLGGVEYQIKFVDGLTDGVRMLEGRINFRQSLIELNSSQEHQQACLTLLHELGHWIIDAYDTERKEDDKVPQDEEKVVEAFARGFYQILQDNGGALFDLERKEATQKDGHSGTDTANAS